MAVQETRAGWDVNHPKDLELAEGEDRNQEPPFPMPLVLIHLPKETLLRCFCRQLQALDARPLSNPTPFSRVTYVFTH